MMISTRTLFLLITVVFIAAHKVYITPDGHPSTSDNNTLSLSHVLNHPTKYLTSNTRLLFAPGWYYLATDFIVQNVSDISIIGNHSTIQCTNSSVGIAIINVTNIAIQNLEISKCGKNHSIILVNTYAGQVYDDMPKLHWRSALLLHYCVSAVVTKVSITVQIGTDGMLVVNAMRNSQICNVHVTTVCPQQQNVCNATTNGILVYYCKLGQRSQIFLHNFTYSQKLQNNFTGSQTVFYILLINMNYKVNVRINYCEYKNLYNVSILQYTSYTNIGPSIGLFSPVLNNPGHCTIYFDSLSVYNNSEDGFKNLLAFKFHGCWVAKLTLKIFNSKFLNNININSAINIDNNKPCFAKQPVFLYLHSSSISFNQAMNLILINERITEANVWSVFAAYRNCIISSNYHKNGKNLIVLNAAYMKWAEVSITNNSFYESVVKLYSSVMDIKSSSNISCNHVRYVLNSMHASYCVISPYSVFTITQNIVYTVLTVELTLKHQSGELCFYHLGGKQNITSYKIAMISNLYTAPLHLIDLNSHFLTCKWLENCDCAFTKHKPSEVLTTVTIITKRQIDKDNMGAIPSSICNCLNSTNYTCRSHKAGEIFPGQTLHLNLIIPKLKLSMRYSAMITAEVVKLPSNGCTIVSASEITQVHTNTGCNEYNYTVWSDKSECELYLSTEGIAEIFYVKLLPCPVGFSLHSHLQQCHCDEVLDCDVISVTTCNLDDGTILRPANSWISADTVNGSHRYHISSQCPFDYCLLHSSYLNLSTPDMQCHFNRSGVLCGHCQQDLSAVFGSSRCKQCSNVYLLIIIPLAIAGVLLVIALFTLSLTVTNGTINTFIFYVNIINTNYSFLLPNCYSPICVMFSIFNLDLGIETCFYNNMTGYAKMWLQLAFPFYLMLMALTLIIGSRYSITVQRFTARKSLPVLATLFLLSYTKILSTVCHVLFFYSDTTYLPERQMQLFWSTDSSIQLFGTKFTLLFVACLIIFIILLLFNALLLFTRFFLRFKLVNNFKPLIDPYLAPYKNRFIFWVGFQLTMRAVYFSLSSFSNKKISLISGVVVTGALLCIQGILRPFKSKFKNIQESLVLLNLLLVHVFAGHRNYNESSSAIVEYLILIVLFYFSFFMLYITLIKSCGRRIKQIRSALDTIYNIWKNKEKNSFKSIKPALSSEVPEVTFNYKEYQEPLVAFNDSIM